MHVTARIELDRDPTAWPGAHAADNKLPATWIWVAVMLALAFIVATPAYAAKVDNPAINGRVAPVYKVEQIREQIRVDGKLDEKAWRGKPTFELAYETRPAENGPPPVRTRFWIAYDRNSIYIAIRASDPDPAKIRARLSDRDSAYQDDFAGVVLDTFDDQRRAYEFFVNPLGVQMDLTQNELTGNEDDSWDAIWDSAGRITESGYNIEMRIPFSSLRFPDSKSDMTWGIDAVRMYPRGQRYRIGLNPLPRGNNCYLCQESKLDGFVGIEPARSMEIDPTFTSSMIGTRTAAGSIESDDPSAEPGVTGRWGMTPNLTLSATLNPDFSQVEADSAQLDINTQFALFYPEKRPFFLEGADLFDTRFNAIYSRNIADPAWGLKLTGKVGKDGIGVIVAQDRRTNFLIPSSQGSSITSLDEDNLSTIIRYRRDLFGATTGGFFYTGREGNGFHNRMLGGDILFKWHDNEAARIEILGSQTLYPGSVAANFQQSPREMSDVAVRAVYQHTDRNWMYYVLYRDIGRDFRADLGFVPQVDFKERAAALERAWYPNSKSWSQVRLGVIADDFADQSGQHLQRTVDFYSWLNGPRQFFLQLDVVPGDQYFNGKTFSTDSVKFYTETFVLPNLYVYSQGRIGKQVDYANTRQANELRLDPGLRFDLGRHLRLNLDYSYDALDVDGDNLFIARLTQLRTTYQLNVRTFVRWIGQYLDVSRNPALYAQETSSSDQTLFNQLLFSYKINPQTVLFFGYSDNYTGDHQTDLTQQNRALFFKIGYAWML